MNDFKKLFGIAPTEVKKTCILTPFLTKKLINRYGIKHFASGIPYSAGNGKDFTLIHTKIGASMLGDCVLYLKDTQCQNVIMHGACGLLLKRDGFEVGSLVAPTSCFAMESFSQILSGNLNRDTKVYADVELLGKLKNFAGNNSFFEVCCATFGSLKHETEKKEFLVDCDIDVLDMECSAFFLAAKHVGLKAIALFYITDVIGEDSYKNIFIKDADPRVKAAEEKLIKLILGFTETLA